MNMLTMNQLISTTRSILLTLLAITILMPAMAQTTPAANAAKPRLIYVYDALCGWCFGFSPVMTRLAKKVEGRVELEVVSGGLRTGADVGPINEVAPYIKTAYKEVEKTCGVKFGDAFVNGTLAKGTLILNSLPPAIAMVIVREQNPKLALPFAAQLHKAIYQDGMGTEDPKAYLPYLKAVGASDKDFLKKMADPNYKLRAEADFKRARSLGADGFPTLILEKNGKRTIITQGYSAYATVEAQLEQLLK